MGSKLHKADVLQSDKQVHLTIASFDGRLLRTFLLSVGDVLHVPAHSFVVLTSPRPLIYELSAFLNTRSFALIRGVSLQSRWHVTETVGHHMPHVLAHKFPNSDTYTVFVAKHFQKPYKPFSNMRQIQSFASTSAVAFSSSSATQST